MLFVCLGNQDQPASAALFGHGGMFQTMDNAIMYLCLQFGEAGAFSPVACFAQLGRWGERKCSSIVVGHRALNQLVVEAVAFFKLSAIHYLAHCNLNVASGLHPLRGDISPSGTIAWITREGYESDWKMRMVVVSRIQRSWS